MCAFVLAYAKSRFSHDRAQMIWYKKDIYCGFPEKIYEQLPMFRRDIGASSQKSSFFLGQKCYCKCPELLDTINICCNHSKIQIENFTMTKCFI